MRKILAFILLACVMVAGAGVPVFAHKCLRSGKVDVSLMPVECSMHESDRHHEENCFEKGTCCELDYHYLKTDISTQLKIQQNEFKTLVSILPISIVPEKPELFIHNIQYRGNAPFKSSLTAQPSLCIFRI